MGNVDAPVKLQFISMCVQTHVVMTLKEFIKRYEVDFLPKWSSHYIDILHSSK